MLKSLIPLFFGMLLLFESGGCSSPCSEIFDTVGDEVAKIVRENQQCTSPLDCVLIDPSLTCRKSCSVAVNKDNVSEVNARLEELETLCEGNVCRSNISCPRGCPVKTGPSGEPVGLCISQNGLIQGTCLADSKGEYCVTCESENKSENKICMIIELPLEFEVD